MNSLGCQHVSNQPRLQGLIDSAFVGRCGGSVQLAALAPGTSFLDSLSYLCPGKHLRAPESGCKKDI